MVDIFHHRELSGKFNLHCGGGDLLIGMIA